jgi:Flp pilus assembly pilin Flp
MRTLATHSRTIGLATAARVKAAVAWLIHTAPQVGQSMVEYAIIAALVAVVALAAVKALGGSVTQTFQNVDSAVQDANDESGGGG